MNVKEIKEIVGLMNENNLSELEIEKEGMRIKIKKGASHTQDAQTASFFIEREKAQTLEPKGAAQPQTAVIDKNRVEVKSPMVGTFYRAPSPEAPPFVELNQEIEPGQVICIIEAMKLMNEIKSEIKGRILEILVDNAEPIEFGQPLFIVENR